MADSGGENATGTAGILGYRYDGCEFSGLNSYWAGILMMMLMTKMPQPAAMTGGILVIKISAQ